MRNYNYLLKRKLSVKRILNDSIRVVAGPPSARLDPADPPRADVVLVSVVALLPSADAMAAGAGDGHRVVGRDRARAPVSRHAVVPYRIGLDETAVVAMAERGDARPEHRADEAGGDDRADRLGLGRRADQSGDQGDGEAERENGFVDHR